MGLVYALNAGDYEPISHGDNYLYHQYDKIASFLLKNYGQEYQQILAKPVLSNGVVNWHANYDFELSRIGDLSHDIQVKIKRLYWELKNRLDQDIDQLEYSSLPEKKKWGLMLRQVFDDENNVILSDGNFWCLLWGWKFKNKSENYLPPEFITPEPAEVQKEEVVFVPLKESETEISNIQMENSIPEEIPVPIADTTIRANQKQKKSYFWHRLKRFFRNFVYQYWGLLLFILLVLFIFCLVQKCTREDCPDIKELNQQLDELNKEISNRCSQQ
jgi:hypothetical protein